MADSMWGVDGARAAESDQWTNALNYLQAGQTQAVTQGRQSDNILKNLKVQQETIKNKLAKGLGEKWSSGEGGVPGSMIPGTAPDAAISRAEDIAMIDLLSGDLKSGLEGFKAASTLRKDKSTIEKNVSAIRFQDMKTQALQLDKDLGMVNGVNNEPTWQAFKTQFLASPSAKDMSPEVLQQFGQMPFEQAKKLGILDQIKKSALKQKDAIKLQIDAEAEKDKARTRASQRQHLSNLDNVDLIRRKEAARAEERVKANGGGSIRPSATDIKLGTDVIEQQFGRAAVKGADKELFGAMVVERARKLAAATPGLDGTTARNRAFKQLQGEGAFETVQAKLGGKTEENPIPLKPGISKEELQDGMWYNLGKGDIRKWVKGSWGTPDHWVKSPGPSTDVDEPDETEDGSEEDDDE